MPSEKSAGHSHHRPCRSRRAAGRDRETACRTPPNAVRRYWPGSASPRASPRAPRRRTRRRTARRRGRSRSRRGCGPGTRRKSGEPCRGRGSPGVADGTAARRGPRSRSGNGARIPRCGPRPTRATRGARRRRRAAGACPACGRARRPAARDSAIRCGRPCGTAGARRSRNGRRGSSSRRAATRRCGARPDGRAPAGRAARASQTADRSARRRS